MAGNAIKNADTPVMDELAKGQYLTLDASGLAVGLPPGLMGNSEVGHFTIGTGRVVYQVCCVHKVERSKFIGHTFLPHSTQDIVAINVAIENKSIYIKPSLVAAFDKAKSKNGRLHFLGLVC